jgi:hypothetical protein
MLSAQARWFLLAALGSSALFACSSDSSNDDGSGGAGTGGASAGSGGGATAGTPSGGAGSPSGGTPSGGASGGSGGAKAGAGGGGAGGASGGTGGTGGTAGGSGGSGGASGGAGGAGGAGGSGGSVPTAVAQIMGLNGQTVTGTATFTQGATMTKLVIDLTACPDGKHSSHLHINKDCGNNGMAAGNHWTPNGENFGDYTCANNKVTHMLERPTSQWTVGDGSSTDVTKYSFMVHAQGDDQGSGDRIGCGLVNKK